VLVARQQHSRADDTKHLTTTRRRYHMLFPDVRPGGLPWLEMTLSPHLVIVNVHNINGIQHDITKTTTTTGAVDQRHKARQPIQDLN